MPRTLFCSLASLLVSVGSVGSVHAAPGDMTWERIRPSNTGVPGDYTHAVFVDNDDSVWISGYITFWNEGGMARFNGERWDVLSNVDCGEIFSPRFNDIAQTPDGTMWIATMDGLLRFDPAAEPWCVTRYSPRNTPMRGNIVTGVDVAPDGSIWFACRASGGSAAGGIGRYEPTTDTWTFHTTANGIPWWDGWDWVNAISVQPEADGGYRVWFYQDSMGMASLKDGQFVWYDSPTPPPGSPRPVALVGKNAALANGDMVMRTTAGFAIRHATGDFTVIGGPPAGVSTTSVAVLEAISGGRVLLGTYSSQVYLWEEGVWTALGGWGGSSHTYALTEQADGTIWAGGIGGAARYQNGQWSRVRLTNTGMLSYFVETITHAPNGDVAMNGNASPGIGGFQLLHPDGSWTNANAANYGDGPNWTFPTDDCAALCYRTDGRLLLAPVNNGVKEFDGVGYRELLPNGLDVRHLAEDGLGRAWAGADSGSVWFESGSGMTRLTSANSPLPAGRITGIVADPEPGFVWIGTAFGLARTDGSTWTVIPRETLGLNQNTSGYYISEFDLAADGRLWVGSGIGLFELDPATLAWNRYDLTNAPLPSDDVRNVEIAPDGSVWISMMDATFPYPGGVARLHEGAWRVWRQGSSPLPHNQVEVLASRATPAGYEVWIGTASEAVSVVRVEGDTACGADVNGDGAVNFFDISAFVGLFGQQDLGADLAEPAGVFNFFDIAAYLDVYAAGCP